MQGALRAGAAGRLAGQPKSLRALPSRSSRLPVVCLARPLIDVSHHSSSGPSPSSSAVLRVQAAQPLQHAAGVQGGAGRAGLQVCRSSAQPELAGGGGNTGSRDDRRGGGGGGGDGSEGQPGGQPMDPKIAAMLAAAGRTAESFPPDFAGALLTNRVTPEILQRFLDLEANFLVKLVWGIQGFRERLLGDPSFPVKVGIECGIGICTKLTAEKTKRQENFMPEIDFVAANVIMALIADFMLTWLPAPTLSYTPKKVSSNKLLDFFANCPDNAFQKVRPGTDPFTLGQRVGAIMRNGGKLLGVGFFSSLFGVAATNGLIAARQFLDPSFLPPNAPQDVLATSATYGVYMAVSSNLRYQVIAGVIEERGIETFLAGKPQLCAALSFIVRTSNTFLGSLLWVDFIRLLGMQKSGG